jgi:DNA-binding beta-propeller fold protein YncE
VIKEECVRKLLSKAIILIALVGAPIPHVNAGPQASGAASAGERDCELARATIAEGCDSLALDTTFAVPVSASTRLFPEQEKASPEPMRLATGYKVAKKFTVPGEGGWDYIAVDGDVRRVYVSHGDLIQVLNADSGKLLGQIAAPGAHGVALALDLGRGFSSNGKDKSVTVFDTKTLAVVKTVKLEGGTDAILYDPFTKRVFPINEKITALDAETGEMAGTFDIGGDPEAAVSDEKGTVYVNLADRGYARVSSRGVKTQRVGIVPHGPRVQTMRRAIQPHPQSFYN